VLERLDPVDRALLGRTGSSVRIALKRSGLARVGGSAEEPRVSITSFCQFLSTFVWTAANGCLWQRTATCHTRARDGRREVLRWAREHGCPWNVLTCARAATDGQFQVLR